MTSNKRFAPAADQNKADIFTALQPELKDDDLVLEIGSGTGQHVCYFAPLSPTVVWQPTELAQNLHDINLWIAEAGCANIRPPIALDINATDWSISRATVCYSANTLHIISEPEITRLFEGCSNVLSPGGKLCIYGPYKFDGEHISESNERFDQSLRLADPASGVRDVTALNKAAHSNGFRPARVIQMPANNRLLIWDY